MTTLTSEQKAVGREFRSRCARMLDDLDASDPPTTPFCAPYTVWYRHDCPAKGSQALFLRQHYHPSPDGLFCFYWRYGKCSREGCGFSVRTRYAFAFADQCPPEKGAVIHAAD